MNRPAAIPLFALPVLMGSLALLNFGCRAKAASTNQGSVETHYKSNCQDLAVKELTKDPETYKGRRVKYTGKVLVMDFPKDTAQGRTPTGLILIVTDETDTAASVYVSYAGSTDAFIYDTVTAYGEVSGRYEYKSPMVKEKSLPWVEAKYLEKSR
jgi:hypothetical protein